MKISMSRYHVTRTFMAIALAALLALTGLAWWLAALAGALTLAWFLWAPRSGRYLVADEGGVAPLRRDERGQAVTDRAARNAFVVTALLLGALLLYYGHLVRQPLVPSSLVGLALAAGLLAYFVSDAWLRRSG